MGAIDGVAVMVLVSSYYMISLKVCLGRVHNAHPLFK
jgi:hypothetical protein